MSAEIIPFGKYQGKSVESLAADKSYADWLIQQPWFREKHANLYSIVINNFTDPSETPEHHSLQARFLDDSFCMRLLWIMSPSDARQVGEWLRLSTREFELKDGGDVLFSLERPFSDDTQQGWIPARPHILTECKPFVGDDYPAVLRQMKRSRGNCLLIREFRSEAINEDQLRQFFSSSGITVIFEREVDAFHVPERKVSVDDLIE